MKKPLNFIFFFLIILSLHGQNEASERDSLYNKDSLSEKILDSIQSLYVIGEYKKSLIINIDFLKSEKTKNNPYYLNEGYKSLGYIYLNIGDSILAKECFLKANKHAVTLHDDIIEASSLMDLGNLYAASGNHNEKAIRYIDKAIELFKKNNDTVGLATAYYNKILSLKEEEKHDQVYALIKKARELSKFSDETFEIDLDLLEGEYHLNKKKYTKADYLFNKTISKATKDSLGHQLMQAYELYSESLLKQKRFEEAYNIREKYEVFLVKDKKQVDLAKGKELSIDFLLDEYREQALEAEQKIKLQNEIANNNILIARILIIFTTCFVILLITLFYAYNKRKKLIKELETKNKKYLTAKKATEGLLESKSNFFSTISHEIRTPLYGVIGISTMLHEDKRLEAYKEDISSLKFSADYLLALINDVLQINQIDSKTAEEEKTNFELRLLVKKLSQSFDYIITKNNNKIHIEIDENIPDCIYGNSIKLTQILLNIIGNACKFTQNGDIYIIAELIKLNDTSTTIKFYIKDNGIGIPYEKQDTIFEEYSQADTINYTYQGTGLGLSIVKRLLQSANSDIFLESEPNKGTQFYFTLSFDLAKCLQEDSVKNNSLLQLKNKHILVVEDNKINLKITKRILENNNMICSMANNGEESIEMARENNYDLIFMDINMDIKDGYKATEKIREFNNDIPIIALTASNDEKIFAKALKSGMNDIVIKPYDVNKFIQKIYEHIILKSKKTSA